MPLLSYVVKNAEYERRGHASGSASTPSVAFANEVNSGLFLTEGASGRGGKMSVSVGGVEQAAFGETSHITNLEADLIVTGDGHEVVDAVDFLSTANVAPATDASVSAGIGDVDAGTRAQRWSALYADGITVDRLTAQDGQLSDAAYDLLLEKIAENGIAVDFSALDESVVPGTDVTLVLGEPTRAWRDLWVSGIRGGDAGAVSIGHVELAVGGHLQVHDLVVDGSVLLDGTPVGDVVDWGNVASDLSPAVDTAHALGLPTRRWKTVRLHSVAGGVVVGGVLTLDAAAVNAEMRLADGTTMPVLVVDSLKLPSGENAIADVDTGNVATDVLPVDEQTTIGTPARRLATVVADVLDVDGAPVTSDADGLVLEHVEMTGFDGDLGDTIECCRVINAEPADETWAVASTWGDRVLLTGTGFSQTMAVWVGGVRADATVVSRTQARVTLPLGDMADSEVWVDVDVVRGDGERANAFSIVYVPTSFAWVTDPQLPPITKGFYYETTVVATAGSHIVTYASDDLPTGLSIDEATGVISGVVDVEVVPELRWTVRASSSGKTIEREFVAVYGGTSVTGLWADGSTADHSTVLTLAGPYTFGKNATGQLLDDRTAEKNYEPVNVVSAIGDEVATMAAEGKGFSLALTESGNVWAGGLTDFGQCTVQPDVPLLNQPPDMTTATLDAGGTPFVGPYSLGGYTIKASSVESNASNLSYEVRTVFNKTAAADGLDCWVSSTTNDQLPWVQITLPTSQTVSSFTMTARNWSPAYFPKKFELQGSHDEASWTTLGTWEIFPVWTPAQKQRFTPPPMQAYRHYRLFFLESTSGVTFSDWSLDLGSDTTPPVEITNEGDLAGSTIVAVAAGESHALALDDAGQVYAWGSNRRGQLGHATNAGTETPNVTPTRLGLAGIVSIGAGTSHSVAVAVDGTVYTWGDNSFGQLNDAGVSGWRSAPTAAVNGSLAGKTVVGVSCGAFHTVAVCDDGTTHACGDSSSGQAGASSGSTLDAMTEMQVGAFVTAAACGSKHTMLLDADGGVWACGSNADGQLGVRSGGSDETLRLINDDVANPSGSLFDRRDVLRLAAGSGHSMAMCSDSVHAWGRNVHGQLGYDDGSTNNADPVDITHWFDLPAVEWLTDTLPVARNGVAYSAQFEATAGGVACTKFLTTSAMPPGLTLSEGGELAGTPSSAIVNAYDIVVTAVGPAGQAATKAFEVRYNWGAGGSLWTSGGGHIGNMTSTALDIDGALWAWGDNTYQTCAHGNHVDKTAVQNVMSTFPAGVRLVTESGGYFVKMALSDDGRVFAWGDNRYGTVGLPSPLTGGPAKSGPNEVTNAGALVGKTVTDIFASQATAFALTSEKSLVCWGYSGEGQLGFDIYPPPLVPTAFPHLGGTVEKVMGGGGTLFALDTSGRLWAWGIGHRGQMGNGTVERINTTPHNITSAGSLSGKTASKVESSSGHVVAMMTDGSVHQWGYINSADVTTPQAVSIPGNRTAVDVAAGSNNGSGEHSAALMSDGTLWTWGENDKGQLGNGTRTANWTPTDISGLGSLAGKKVIELAKGQSHTVALCDDGTLHGWGANENGQLIFPVVSTVYLEPVELQAIPGMAPPSITWTTDAALPNASEGEAYSVVLEATPGVVEYEITSGALPSWASFDAATGEISGTPDAIVRSHAFGVTAYSTAALPSTNAFELRVNWVSAASALWTAGNGWMMSWARGGDALVGWGDNTYRQLAHADLTAKAAPVDVIDEFPEGTVVERVTTGGQHTLVLTADKKLYSFGNNFFGGLGHGANTSTNTPNAPRDITANGALSGRTIDTIVAASGTSYAVCTDGRIVGWGSTGYGELQLGGSNGSDTNPYPTPTLKNPSAVQKLWGCGQSWFAQNTSNQLFSWGYGSYGQIGNGTSMQPINYNPANITSSGTLNGKVVAKISGDNYILAMATDGTLHEWGLIGDRWNGVLRPRAKALPGGRTAVEIFGTSGMSYAVSGYAVADDGTVWSWGGMYDSYYYYGQLGNGATSVTDSWTPTEITNSGSLAGKTVVELSGSQYHVIARCSDGSLHGWGANDQYQLVDGGEAAYYVPIELEIEALGPPSITWTTDAALPAAFEGVAYSVTLEATPDVVEYEITSGALPSWASFDTATGEISGTPDAVPQTAELSVTAYSTAATPSTKAFRM